MTKPTHEEHRQPNLVAIVTGGGSGIGAALCKALARAHATVIVAGPRSRPGESRGFGSRSNRFHLSLLETFENLIVLRISPLWNGNVMLVVAGFASLWTVTYYLAKFSFEKFEAPILSLKRYARSGSSLPAFEFGEPADANPLATPRNDTTSFPATPPKLVENATSPLTTSGGYGARL